MDRIRPLDPTTLQPVNEEWRDRSNGTRGHAIPARLIIMLLEELAHLVESALGDGSEGDGLNPNDDHQILAAILALIAANAVPSARSITGGEGLSGGGDLSANRTISMAIHLLDDAIAGDIDDNTEFAAHVGSGHKAVTYALLLSLLRGDLLPQDELGYLKNDGSGGLVWENITSSGGAGNFVEYIGGTPTEPKLQSSPRAGRLSLHFLDSANLNAIDEAGAFMVNTPTNGPAGTTNGTVISHYLTANEKRQTFFSRNSLQWFHRDYQAGAWGPWTEIGDKAVYDALYAKLSGGNALTGTQTIETDPADGHTQIESERIEIGAERTADGLAYIDLHSSTGNGNFNARVMRREGVDGDLEITQTGNGTVDIDGGSQLRRDGNLVLDADNTPVGTPALLSAGTDTTPSRWSAETLHDEFGSGSYRHWQRKEIVSTGSSGSLAVAASPNPIEGMYTINASATGNSNSGVHARATVTVGGTTYTILDNSIAAQGGDITTHGVGGTTSIEWQGDRVLWIEAWGAGMSRIRQSFVGAWDGTVTFDLQGEHDETGQIDRATLY